MSIPQSLKEQACEALLHFYPKATLSRELNISKGALRDWQIFIENGFFDWVTQEYVGQRKPLLKQATAYWFEHYPIGYSDVARQFGLRPAALYSSVKQQLSRLPAKLRPRRIQFWDHPDPETLGAACMPFERLSDIPSDRPLSSAERKALIRELGEARDRLICAESLLEVAVESCKDELKKKNCSGNSSKPERS